MLYSFIRSRIVSLSLVLTLLLSSVVAFSAEAAPCIQPPSGMVAWWTGDGNANDVIGGYNGGLHGNASYASGWTEQAFSFDGAASSYVEIANSADVAAFNPTGAFSVDGWFYIDPAANAGKIATLIGKTEGSWGNGWAIYFDDRGSMRNLQFIISGVAVAQNAVTAASWYHVAGVFDPAATPSIKLYLNGSLAASDNGSAGSANNLNVRIGAMHWTDAYHAGNDRLNGKADEVSFFSRALSAAEVAAIYNAGGSGICKPCVAPPSGLVSWWAGDDNAQDMRGANPGTLMNGATFADGRVGRSFLFDGQTSRTKISSPVGIPSSGPITVMAWLKTDSSALRGLSPEVLSIGADSFCDDGGFHGILLSGGKRPGIGRGCALSPNFSCEADVDVGDNQWHHVATMWDGSAYSSVYVDGTLRAHCTGADYTHSTANIWIGGREADFTDSPYHGLIDEVQVFSRALSAPEISAIYNSGSGGLCKPCTAPPSGMVGWWKGDGNYADAIGTNHGTPTGGPGFAPGKVGQGFSFSGGSSGIRIPSAPALAVQSFSVDAWIYPNNGDNFPVVEWSDDTNFGVHLWVNQAAAPGRLYANVVDTSGGYHVLTVDSTVALNSWSHVALTFDSSTGTSTLYRNGAQVGQKSDGAFLPLTAYNVYLGRRPNPEYSANGLIDEVELFNRALSASEIAALYNAGCAGKCFTPQSVPAAFTFTDVTGATPNDLRQSNEITVTGINVPTTVSLDAGHYALNGGPCNLVSGTARNGDKLVVCLAASGSYAATVSATLTVGTVSDTFSISTVSAHLISVEAVPSAARTFTPASWEVAEGGNIGTNIIPNAGYYFVSATDNCGPGGVQNGAPYDSNRSYSVFSGTSDCTVTVTYAEYEVRREDGPVYHHTVQEAFSAVAAQDTIRLRELLFDETSTGGASYTGGFPVTLTGGAQSGFVPDLLKFSTITPGLVLSGGPVTISNIAIK